MKRTGRTGTNNNKLSQKVALMHLRADLPTSIKPKEEEEEDLTQLLASVEAISRAFKNIYDFFIHRNKPLPRPFGAFEVISPSSNN